MTSSLQALRSEFQELPPPIIVFNKSHSGSRLLAKLIETSGVFLGAHQNESKDSLDLFRLVEYLVCEYYPDYSPLWQSAGPRDEKLMALIRDVFTSHREGASAHGPWGWKLCETGYILPVLDYLFPQARYIHLIRDGRDVAFCDHTPPDKAFWKKIYFNTDRIESSHHLRLEAPEYRHCSHVYNAIHWTNSVAVGRAYGAMLRERYLEVRYEDLCCDFELTARRILDFIGAPCVQSLIEDLRQSVHLESVAKYRTKPNRKLREVIEIEKSMLLALGYLEVDPYPPSSRAVRHRVKTMLGRKIGTYFEKKS